MDSLFKKLIIIAIVVLSFLAVFASASTPEPPAVPRDYVVDLASVISPDVSAQLNGLLLELEQKTSAQVLVLTVQSLDGEEIRSFGIRIAEKWKLGHKGKDNGALLVVAVKDRKYTIEIGYGLESVLPDSLVGTIGREYFVPYFRKGDYSYGIYAGTVAIVRTIAGHEGASITGATGQEEARSRVTMAGRPISLFHAVVFGIFALIALVLFITHPRQCLLLLLASQMGGGRGGWSGGSGGFGGGGGSFGGGGGGGFGGGGASGGW
ncbi:MAG TPA: TPM domain-containing protein [Nitrospirota bacterium]|nr:TPM domain-containing protein [Nitrospirota bacterium]